MTEIKEYCKKCESYIFANFVPGYCDRCSCEVPEKEQISHLITTIESQERTIKTYEEVQQGWLDRHARNIRQIRSLQKENTELKQIILKSNTHSEDPFTVEEITLYQKIQEGENYE